MKTKIAYYEFKDEAEKYFGGLKNPITNYVNELEQLNAEMLKELNNAYIIIDFIKDPVEIKIAERIKALIEKSAAMK